MTGEIGRVESPGVRYIINRLRAESEPISSDNLIDGCLEMLGGYELMPETRSLLLEHINLLGDLNNQNGSFDQFVGQILQLIVSTQEYQFS